MRKADVVCVILLLGMAGVVAVEGLRLGIGWGTDGPQSGFFVFYLGVALTLATGTVLFQTLARGGASASARRFLKPGQTLPVATVLLPAVGMVLLTHFVGLYVAGTLYMAVYMRWIGRHAWWQTVAVSVAVPAVAFLIFEVWFLVPMPKGPLETYLGY